MPDPKARKRLKKKMLDRWENEGGSIVSETTSEDEINTTSKGKDRAKKSSTRDTSSAGGPASTAKTRKPANK
ncbi:MAG TPA: hypothetical protein VIT88_12835 [Pyrinomonadaceae bacterium]